MTEYLYRAEPLFEERQLLPEVVVCTRILMRRFKVIRETPCGFWINKGGRRKDTFVLKGTGKRFAHATKTQAVHSLKRRKKAQKRILESQLERTGQALELVLSTPIDTLVETAITW